MDEARMPSLFITHSQRTSAPTVGMPLVRAQTKENRFAPAMVSQEEVRLAADLDFEGTAGGGNSTQ
jgi:hypothetical protein